MNIDLRIERLIFDGLPTSAAEGTGLRAALEDELRRLLQVHGLGAIASGAMPQLSVPSVRLSAGGNSAQWGREIARTLYDGLSPAPPTGNDPATLVTSVKTATTHPAVSTQGPGPANFSPKKIS